MAECHRKAGSTAEGVCGRRQVEPETFAAWRCRMRGTTLRRRGLRTMQPTWLGSSARPEVVTNDRSPVWSRPGGRWCS